MGQERGSAMISVSLLILCIMVLSKTSFAATYYMVGDGSGWGFGVTNWPHGKTFKAGDVLVFKYSKAYHDVAVVDKEGYERCYVSEDDPVFETGDEYITLTKGYNYFICGFPQHCHSGMKIAIKAD